MSLGLLTWTWVPLASMMSVPMGTEFLLELVYGWEAEGRRESLNPLCTTLQCGLGPHLLSSNTLPLPALDSSLAFVVIVFKPSVTLQCQGTQSWPSRLGLGSCSPHGLAHRPSVSQS